MKLIHLTLYLIFLVGLFSSCERQDDFYSATKIINAPDTIQVNREFPFRLILRNDSNNEMKFTIDQTVQKSLFFNLNFYCDTTLLHSDVPNPKSFDENFKVYMLKKGDSLTFNLSGILMSQPNDGLAFKVKGYENERVYKLKNPNCQKFNIDFSGMWLPGETWAFDAMEGYNFRKTIFVTQ
ncbi:hypothetical protein I5M27_10515 [Adhaeribacter sp. BT258]|uniref:Lipoprotein n=1 Tax=Adhaeribacter terrigena TaxID=2793070 RepID=A0ABS1C208_9BACT|nr:hypothetical protein [Adhaeribacter terrigena]MBK0403420.1 hypothetical protein [Adhaeribacter terrigena]